MPKLIVDRPNNRPRKVPCGRVINYREPHSPFQLLIDSRRRELAATNPELSSRGLARAIGVSQSTLWIWLHSENGYPAPKSFKDRHMTALSRVLKIAPADIRKAIDSSRIVYGPKTVPIPIKTKDAFRAFIDILKNDRRENITRKFALNLARNLYNGATGEKV